MENRSLRGTHFTLSILTTTVIDLLIYHVYFPSRDTDHSSSDIHNYSSNDGITSHKPSNDLRNPPFQKKGSEILG